jgi:beta-galactosidase
VTGDKPSHPHQVVIDLGEQFKVTGFRILPRSDKSTVGAVKDFKIYLESAPIKF